MENDKTIIIQQDADLEDDKIDFTGLADFFFLCVSKWKWFLLSLVLCFGCAVLYLCLTPPKYTRIASVHIKEDSRSSSIGNISDEFANLGFGGTSGSAANEVVAFNSPELAEQVVKQLHLNIVYTKGKGLRRELLFGRTLPFTVSFQSLDEEQPIAMNVTLLPSGKLFVANVTLNNKEKDVNSEVGFDNSVYLGDVYMSFHKTDAYFIPNKPLDIKIVKSPLSLTANALHSKLEATQNDKRNSIIDIKYTDQSIERAETVINTLINEYNKNWVKDKNELGKLTSLFINERISVIEQELGGVDSDIASFKSDNMISDVSDATSMYLSQANESDKQVQLLMNQVFMCRFLHDYVANPSNANKLIPANVGIQSSELTALVTGFNDIMSQRNTYITNSSDKNPLVQTLDEKLASQRVAILQSIDNEQKSLEIQISSAQKTKDLSNSVLSNSPVQQRQLLSMDRQQKIKESLYLFLLQKREENELSQAFTAYNTRIISRPMGPNKPTSPVPFLVLLIALVVSLIIPAIFIYVHDLLNSTVRGRSDIEKLTIPFLGEIPENDSSEKNEKFWNRFSTKQNKQNLQILVAHGEKNTINEAFRIVRSNLSFILHPNRDTKRQVVLVTSTNVSSGKSFVSLNLATAFSLQNNTKVAIVDLDIRKASLSRFIGDSKIGVTDYLGDFATDWHDLIVKKSDDSKVDVLPAGHTPPNPSELLQSDKLPELLEQMKQEYDIIFVDMPPVEIVADVSIVKHLADVTLFVIRKGVFIRSMLPNVESYYKNGYFNNLTLLLNGTDVQSHKYGHYGRYGRYGYGYGYGYGREYGHDKSKK